MGRASLIGRGAELHRVARVLADDGPAAVVVSGAAGIGKTRLLAEVAATARDEGWAVEQLFASRAARAIPFGVVSHLLPPEPSEDTSALLRAARAELRRRAGERPLLLIVDDSHLLDDGSAVLVRQAAVRRDVKVVLAQRTGEPPSDEVVSLWKDGHAERVELQALSRPDTSALADQVLGGPTTEELREAAWRLSLGHPLFLVTALESARESGMMEKTEGGWRNKGPLAPSELLDELLLSRLRGLDQEAIEAFQTIAVAEPIPERIASKVVSRDALRRLQDRGLVEISGSDTDRRISTPHPIYADLVSQMLATDRKRAIAGALADAMLEQDSLTRGERLHGAVWLLEAGRTLEYGLALDAAGEASTRQDLQLTERFARAALAARPHDPDAGLALGRSLEIQGRGAEAQEILSLVIPHSDEHLAAFALLRSHVFAFGMGRPVDGAAVLAEAVAHLKQPVPDLEVERGMYLAMTGSFDHLFRAAGTALRDRSLGDAARLRVLVNLSAARAMSCRFDGFEAEVDLATTMSSTFDATDPGSDGQLMLNRTLALAMTGRLAEAEQLIADRASLGDRMGTAPALTLARLGVLAGLRGDLRAAIRALTRALTVAEPVYPFDARPQILGYLVTHQAQARRAHKDASQQIEDALAHIRDQTRPAVWLGRARAWLAASAGDRAAGARIALEAGRMAVERDHLAWGGLALHDAVRMGHAELVARDLVRALEGHEGCVLLETMRDHALALEAADPEGLVGIAKRFLSLGSPLLAGECAAQAARLAREQRDDARAARSALLAALAIRRCTWVATVAAEGMRSGLTDREIEVAELAAFGLSSRELAQRLVLSVRTVDNHLRSIYRKLGIAGREDLTDIVEPSSPKGNE